MPHSVDELRKRADNQLLEVLGANAYIEALALMRELEDLVQDLSAEEAAAALSCFQTLVALRYAARQQEEQGQE